MKEMGDANKITGYGEHRELYRISTDEILYFEAVFAVALLTSMSYILSTVMIGCFGFVYGIAKKSLRTAIMVWGTCLVNIAYLGISTLLH